MNNISYCCKYCNKIYKRQNAFNNHLAKCKLNNNIKIVSSTNNNYKTQYNKIISNETIFNMLLELNNKYEKLQKDYDELKKHSNIIKNKISILDYLNNNYSNFEYDFVDFTKSISIGLEELELIFKNDYINGIIEIINNILIRNNNIPLKAFNQKENCLYFYSKENKYWKILENDDFNKFIKYFSKNLLNIFAKWKLVTELKLSNEEFSEIYIKNMKKVIGGNFEKKNINQILHNKIYKLIKVDLKKIVTYEFI